MRKSKFELPFLSGLMIPVVIVLAAVLIIYGIMSLLSPDRSYRDLVKEMQTKTFGNRWVAAFELSKHLASSSIPPEDVPWVVENLISTYQSSPDGRTRNFIIIALGTLKSAQGYEFLAQALKDPDAQVQFHTLVTLGNMPAEFPFPGPGVLPFLKAEDPGLRQVAALALANHHVLEAENEIAHLLNDQNKKVQYAAATALIYYKNALALPLLREIFSLKAAVRVSSPSELPVDGLDASQIENLKLNVVNALGKIKWTALNSELESLIREESNIGISTKAREVLKLLKN